MNMSLAELIELVEKYINNKDWIMAARTFRLMADECIREYTKT